MKNDSLSDGPQKEDVILFTELENSLRNVSPWMPAPALGQEHSAALAVENAVTEVIAGTKLCLEKGIFIGVALLDNFNIKSTQTCVIALNHKSRGYYWNCLDWEIDDTDSLGFSPSDRALTLLDEADWQWATLYSLLWREAAKFFEEHPIPAWQESAQAYARRKKMSATN